MEITKEQYFNLKSQGLRRAAIASKLEIPEWKLKRLISKNGWGAKRPVVANANAFSDLTEHSCYWGGFIAADGCITSDTLKICLNYDDTLHIEKFKSYVASTHKITSNTDKYYRSEIGFKNLTINKDLLNNFNITNNKSLTYVMPDIDNDMFRHFLRGYFDGDGSICESFSNKNSITATLYATITGSHGFINAIEVKLLDILGIKGTVQNKGRVSTLKYTTNKAKILLNYLYKDSTIYLDRKYSKYVDIVVKNNRLKV